MFVHRATALGAVAQRRVAEFDDLAAVVIFLVITKVELEFPVLFFFVVFEGHLGDKWPTGFGPKTIQRANLFVAHELLDFGRLEGAAGG